MVTYTESINERLKPLPRRLPLVVDLFAGCGGLALGFEAQGFETHGFEMDANCVRTYRRNLAGNCSQTLITEETELPKASVVIGGPPCQPFSVGGNQAGLRDSRDGFPCFVSAIRRLMPEIWMFENVRGLLYRNKVYLEQILQTLRSFGYAVEAQLLNAVHYEVPQNRERVIVVGHRGLFNWPQRALNRITAGEALFDLAQTTPAESKFLTPSMDAYIAKYEKASSCINARDLRMEAPARTLTCRNLAGATGDMQRVRLQDGRRRRLLIREAARLQSFPDWFEFEGGETSIFNQIGNAVPPMFALHLAGSVREYIESDRRLTKKQIEFMNQPAVIQLSLLTGSVSEPSADYKFSATRTAA